MAQIPAGDITNLNYNFVVAKPLQNCKAIRCQSASLKDREEECKKVPTARKNNKCDPLFSIKRLSETREGLDIDKKVDLIVVR